MKKPANYTTCFPYLFVEGAEAYLEFLTKGLGAVEEGRSLNPAGKVANARVRFDDTVIMLSEAEERFPVSQVTLYLFVEDADASVAQALQCGGVLEMSVMDMDYGDRQGGVRDPQGNIWWLSQHLGGDYD